MKIDVGDQIFVVGSPYGLSRTLTAGHVSGRHALNKRSENTTAVEFLQTDAAINSGNSGSPLFSLNGEVMGIVSQIMSRSGGSEGLAFAATSNTARRLLLEQKPFWSGIEGLLGDQRLSARTGRQPVNSHAVGFILGVTAPCHLAVSGHRFSPN